MKILFRGSLELVKKIKKSLPNELELIHSDYLQEVKSDFDVIMLDFTSSTIQADRDINFLKSKIDFSSVSLINIISQDGNQLDFSVQPDEILIYPFRKNDLKIYLDFFNQKFSKNGSPFKIKEDDLIINEEKYEVKLGEEVIDLTYKEYELLRHLVKNKNRVFARDSLLKEIWGYDYYGGTRTMDVHIRRLRVGYRFSN